MSRFTFILAGLLGFAGLSSGGCRSCSSCHDYDPPVANCQCGSCGAQCGCTPSCGCEHPAGPFTPASPAPSAPTAPTPQVNGASAMRNQNNQQQRNYSQAMTNDYPQQQRPQQY